MCGITGYIDFSENTSREVLERMTASMSHRGLDGQGVEVLNSKVGFGHRRLSIIDLTEGGQQPMQFRNLTITYNGEIYNYKEIKDDLSKLGHKFDSNSDTEMILHAFKEWGINCINRFIGMFAFSIHDKLTDKVYLVRDRAGVKPLFYYHNADLFLFGSELKALLQHDRFKKELNLDAVAAYMQYSYVPTPHCIWRKTYKLEPGHFLIFDVQRNQC